MTSPAPVGRLLVRGGELVTPSGLRAADLVLAGDRIEGMVDRGAASDGGSGEVGADGGPGLVGSGGGLGAVGADGGLGAVGADGGNVVDASGLLVAPGFLDLQVNGGYGIDLTSQLEDDPDLLWALAARLPEQGVTSFLPTIVSAPARRLEAGRVALQQRPPDHVGAEPLGLHAEGPMLAPSRRGTHELAHLAAPGQLDLAAWTPEQGVRLATLAPELPGAVEAIRRLVDQGVVVAIGHTDASWSQARAGIEAGARAGTHLFNAMSGWSAREPGAAGALLDDDRLAVGMIVDGVHLHPTTVRLAWQRLGPARTILVTDAIAAAGTDDAVAALGDRHLDIRDGAVRDAEGALAGSILTLDRALQELVATTGAEVADAVQTVTSTPARLLGESRRGILEVGARGDVVLLTPELEVVATFVGGRLAALPRLDRIDLPDELLPPASRHRPEVRP